MAFRYWIGVMLSVEEALNLVLDHARQLQPTPRSIDDARGCVLAEAIVSDIDSPPHDKSVVDGYAVIAADVAAGGVELTILEEVTAGAVPTRTVEPGTATRIMTGAPIPAGADAVVMVEQTEMTGDRVRILRPVGQAGPKHHAPGRFAVARPNRAAAGQAAAGDRARACWPRSAAAGLRGAHGRRVAVLATGNELVACSAVPGAGQIRNSNGPMLAALARGVGRRGVGPRHCPRRTRGAAARHVGRTAHDVLVISGGVSAGVLDLVPNALEQLGVQQVFHKVNLKPGKPLWFGVSKTSKRNSKASSSASPATPSARWSALSSSSAPRFKSSAACRRPA